MEWRTAYTVRNVGMSVGCRKLGATKHFVKLFRRHQDWGSLKWKPEQEAKVIPQLLQCELIIFIGTVVQCMSTRLCGEISQNHPRPFARITTQEKNYVIDIQKFGRHNI